VLGCPEAQGREPGIATTRPETIDQTRQDGASIAEHSEVATSDPTERAGIDVDVHELSAGCEVGGPADHTIVKACP
jgi:hypothetical protein